MSRPKVSFRFEGLLNRPWKRNESLLWKNSTFFRGNDSFLPGLLPRESLKSQQKRRCRSCHATEASKRKRKLICWWDLFGRLISNNSQSSISDTVRTLGLSYFRKHFSTTMTNKKYYGKLFLQPGPKTLLQQVSYFKTFSTVFLSCTMINEECSKKNRKRKNVFQSSSNFSSTFLGIFEIL